MNFSTKVFKFCQMITVITMDICKIFRSIPLLSYKLYKCWNRVDYILIYPNSTTLNWWFILLESENEIGLFVINSK